ncbi:MAG TPA: hypothetical protein VKX17_28880 [Planctomycetota bacterium]|nr:hypothetical protein [Planctomycetota bacterium]
MNAYENYRNGARAPQRPFAPSNGALVAIASGLLAAAIAAAAAVSQHPAAAGAAAAVAGLAGTVFILRHPSVLLWMLLLSTPFNDLLAFDLGGLNIRPYEIFALLGMLGIVWQFLGRRKSAMRDIAARFKVMLLIAVLLIVSKVVSILSLTVLPYGMSKFFCLKYVVFLALQFAAAFVCASLIDSRERLQQAIRAWIHVSNLVCFIALIQLFLANAFGMDLVVHRDVIPIGRAYSVFREPDVLGCYLAAVMVMLVPLIVARVNFVGRGYLWMSLTLHGVLLLLSVVRAGWVALLVTLVLYALLVLMTRRFKSLMPYLNGALVVCAFAAAGMAMAAPAAAGKLIARVASVSDPKADSASEYRLRDIEAQADLALHPRYATGGPMTTAFGYGDFSWSYWVREVVSAEDYDQTARTRGRNVVLINAGFNMPLAIQFDNGLAGLILHAAFFLALALNFLRALRRSTDPVLQALLLATFLPIVAILICYQFSYDPLFLTLWVLIGLHLAAVYHAEASEIWEAERVDEGTT